MKDIQDLKGQGQPDNLFSGLDFSKPQVEDQPESKEPEECLAREIVCSGCLVPISEVHKVGCVFRVETDCIECGAPLEEPHSESCGERPCHCENCGCPERRLCECTCWRH